MSRKPQTHTGSVRLTAARTLAVAPLVATSLVAQVPSPVQPLPTRRVHETMAPTTSTTQLNGTSPLFQYPDGQWNHGEGFTTAGADEDQGGWFNEESGDGLTPSDIHTTRGWTSWTWTNPINPSSGAAIRNFVGYLRPNNNLPDTHPLYGQLGAGQGPFGNGTYVDQGAFEVFAPIAGPGPTQKIVVVINNWESTAFPKDHQGRVLPWNVYEGFFSPDGLVRPELSGTRSLANFQANTSEADVKRAAFAADAVATATSNGATYWPISAYAVCSMPGRQTTLNEQRNMQLRQAVLLMLQQPDARNPLYPAFLSAQDIEQRVVVVFIGGSNGGHQSMWAAMRHPDKVHGTYAEVINPSIQRLFGEHDLGFAYSRLAGLPEKGATVTEWDFMNWGRYTWNQGKWIHDISLLRRQARNQAYRPSCFRVADEDITSTGTDWVAVANQGAWLDHGQSPVSNPAGWGISSKLSWSVTRFACHDAGNQTVNPYTNTPTYYAQKVIHEVILAAIANRTAQLAAPTQPLVPAPIPSEDRPAGPAQLRGLDDPHEWALGRKGTAMATSNSLLAEDATWFNRVQPGAAGTWLGTKESILISAGRVYVVGAEGVVTAFAVDLTAGMRHRLVKVAQTHDANGRPKSLGLDA